MSEVERLICGDRGAEGAAMLEAWTGEMGFLRISLLVVFGAGWCME